LHQSDGSRSREPESTSGNEKPRVVENRVIKPVNKGQQQALGIPEHWIRMQLFMQPEGRCFSYNIHKYTNISLTLPHLFKQKTENKTKELNYCRSQ
jgi:hypothetical protein